MSSIGGPGGIGGPKGPSGARGSDEIGDAAEIGDTAGADEVGGAQREAGVDAARAARAASELEAMAADIAAGKLTAREAVDRLVDDIAGTTALGDAERTELRELLTELVASDPYMQSLVGRA